MSYPTTRTFDEYAQNLFFLLRDPLKDLGVKTTGRHFSDSVALEIALVIKQWYNMQYEYKHGSCSMLIE